MSDHEYSQGICQDGAAILKDGVPMSPEEIIAELKSGQAARSTGYETVTPQDITKEFERYKRAVITGARRDKVEVCKQFSFADFRAGYKAGQWSPVIPPAPIKVQGVSDTTELVLASLGHYQTESNRCRARYQDVVTNVQGPKNPPVFCVLAAGHDGPHRGKHGAKMRENLIEFGPAISVCAKCKVRWPCPDAESALKAAATPQPAKLPEPETERNPAASRQYYFKQNGCPAREATDPECICWHDEGTGLLRISPEFIKTWRPKPPHEQEPNS